MLSSDWPVVPVAQLAAVPPDATAAAQRLRRWRWIWAAQALGTLATGVGTFVVAAWLLQAQDGVGGWTLLQAVAVLPAVLLLPWAGMWGDRPHTHRRMAWALATLALAALVAGWVLVDATAVDGRLPAWATLVGVLLAWALASAAAALPWPAFSAALSRMVPPQRLARATAWLYVGESAQFLLAPICAGWLFVAVGAGPTLLGVAVVALGAAAVVRACPIPDATQVAAAPDVRAKTSRFPLPRDKQRAARALGALPTARPRERWHDGFVWLGANRGFLHLQGVFAVSQGATAAMYALVGPLLIALTSPQVAGRLLSVAAAGMLAGVVLMGLCPRRNTPILRIRQAEFVAGGLLLAMGVWPSVWMVTAAGAAMFALQAVQNAYAQHLWQVSTPPAQQARIFAARKLVSWSLVPLGYLLAGPLVDAVLVPRFQHASDPLLAAVGWVWVGLGGLRMVLALVAGRSATLVALDDPTSSTRGQR